MRDSLNLPRPGRRPVNITDLTDDALQLIGQYVASSGVTPPHPSSYNSINRRPSTIQGYHEGSYRRESTTIDGWSGPQAREKAEETREYWASRMGHGHPNAEAQDEARGRAPESPSTPPTTVYTNRLIPDPRSLLPLMLTCRTFNRALKFEHNPKLYRWLYLETFDSEALIRRWKSYQKGGFNHYYHAVRTDGQTESHASTWCCTGEGSNDKKGQVYKGQERAECSCREGIHLLNDPSIFANEYKERFEVFKRLRSIAKAGNMEGMRDTPAGREAFTEGIWTLYWMHLEHGE